jgi:NitT/TauT family transport system substrate-binding protein
MAGGRWRVGRQRFGLLVAAVLLAGCGNQQDDPTTLSQESPTLRPRELTKMTLALNWFPEAEHGGYYHAKIRGLYAKHGIDLEIIKGGPGTPVEIEVGAGRKNFGIVNADKILSTRAEGVPIVGLLAPFQVSPRCIIVRESSPVKTFDDLKNMTLIANPAKPFVKFLQHKHGLEGVTIIPYKGGLATFLSSANAAVQGYINSEPLILADRGERVRTLSLAATGFNPYTSVLVTSEKMITENPELVQGMVRASQTGWLSYLLFPAPANSEIQRQNSEIETYALEEGAKQLGPLMLTGDARSETFGTMTGARWAELQSQLIACGAIKDTGKPVSEAFTTEFLR